jgi:hypothetical protein
MRRLFQPVPKPEVKEDCYFGACPVCGKTDGYLNVGGNHWFVCDTDFTKWCIGWNLFSDWREEPERVHQENAATLAGYIEVRPVYPDEAGES